MIDVELTRIGQHSDEVFSLSFRATSGEPLADASAGAHIRITLPDGAERSYSLVNPPGPTGEYEIAIGLKGRPAHGSRYLCELAKVGDRFRMSPPVNRFALVEDAPHSTLIAGGIGITPLWSMIQRLEQLERPWRLFYAMRHRDSGAFLDRLEALEARQPGRVELAIGDGAGSRRLDIEAIVASTPDSGHLYCCGPASMLDAFRTATLHRDASTVHLEYFGAQKRELSSLGYTLELARSKRTVFVPPGRTALDVLHSEGIDVAYGCKQGICGTCETRVLSGTPDHRDEVLSDEERVSNRTMMLCCSGCVGERLVLDL